MRALAIWILTGIICGAIGVAPASAQSHAGVRAGLSVDPDQFFFGGHIETRPLVENLTFRPNVEIGVGDGVTLAAINLEFAYWLPARTQPWRVYFGAGPAAIIASWDDDDHRGRGDSDAGGGFNVFLGAQHREGLFTELKVGFADSPDLKITVGFAFR